jgi:glycerol-3-phosphate acyltransferase PlsY
MMKRIFKWIAFNGVMAVAVYFGVVKHVEGVERIAYFAAWVAVVMSCFQVAPSIQAAMAKRGRTVSAWIDVPFDIMIALVFIWDAAWITDSFYFLHMIIQQACWANALKKPEEDKGEKNV